MSNQNLLNLDENVETLQAVVINAVWSSDIEMHFNTFPMGSAFSSNMLDKGIVRFCQLATLLRTASLFDKDSRATSLENFFNLPMTTPPNSSTLQRNK